MKKIYLLFLISFVNIYFSQTSFHDTTGNIDVNAGGQLQYTLPIAVPPGIKNVAPQINIVYTSGAGNGIAGYGWNINGITAISRVGRDIERDGEIKKVKLDYSDLYSLNGQRLILKPGTGTYGANGAEYVTEKYSNIKIKSIGSISGQLWQGPEYWEVTFEDGSQAWYGGTTTENSTARTPVEYNIVKWKDAQGNYITYNYTQSANVATISSIKWGGNETINTPHFNEIIFNYQTRNLKEVSYSNSVLFEQTRLLNSVQVKASGVQFKKYSIAYETTNFNNDPTKIINYNYVKSITEYNSNNEAATPVIFATSSLQTSTYEQSFGDFNDIVTSGDYNGDGRVDFLLKQPAQNGRPEGYYIYFDPINNTSPTYVYLGASTNSFFPKDNTLSFNIKSSDNIVKAKQGIVTVKNIAGSSPQTTGTIEIKYYSVKSDSSVLNTLNYPLVLEYSKTVPASSYEFDESLYTIPNPDYDYLEETKKSSFATPKEIDIDSDGISELIISVADAKCYKRIIVPDPIKTIWTCENLGYRYLIVDNNDLAGNSQHIISTPTTKNILSKTSIMDLDNNGKQDIMFINNSTGNTNVTFYVKDNFSGTIQSKTYNTPVNNIDQYEITKAESNYSINKKNTFIIKGLSDGIVYGDLNGDKNIEILMPIHEAVNNQQFFNGWSIYLNDGKSLSESIQGLAYYRKQTDSNYYEYNTAALIDLNNDGKSELINSVAYFSENTDVGYWFLYNYREFKYDPTNTQFKWSYIFEKIHEGSRNNAIITPIIADFRINNSYSKISFILKEDNNNNALKLVSFKHYDLSYGKNITSVSQGGLTTYIDYKELDQVINPNLYAQIKSEQYPYMELDKVSQSYVVSQLKQASRKQDFRYRGLLIHLQGRGMIGFRQTARSSWYADGFENTKIWSGVETDPQKYGVPVKEWSIKTNDEELIFPADLSLNNQQLLTFKQTTYSVNQMANGVDVILPQSVIEKDFLKNITAEKTIQYGDYYLPSQTISNINNNFGVLSTKMLYLHNSSGVGKDYYIGRPASKVEERKAYTFTDVKSNFYTYENNLLKTNTTIAGYDIDNNIIEEYYYDGFGNITQKISSNSLDSQTVNSTDQYDSTGRFILKKTDNLGLVANFTYNAFGQLLTQTDSFNNSLTNTYDNWGKLLNSVSSLSGTTSYIYGRDPNWGFVITQIDPDGNISRKFTNVLGQLYKVQTKGFEQNTYIATYALYDLIGRKTHESEPYFDIASEELPGNVQWNTITYDDSVYPSKVTAQSFNNGKKTLTTISGNTVTIKELNGYGRTTLKTTDALGNVISSTDVGGTINFAYNVAGQVTRATYGENVVSTSYDAWGRKSQFSDPANGTYTYEYTGFGDIKKEVSPKGYKQYNYRSNGVLDNVVEKSNDNTSTDKNYSYTYNQYWQPTAKTGTANGKSFSTQFAYHSNGRLGWTTDYAEGRQFYKWDIAYDAYGNIKTYRMGIISNGVTTETKLENFYSTWDGSLKQVKEQNTGKVLWELQTINEKGQVLTAKLGAVQITNTYDSFGFLSKAKHLSPTANLMEVDYVFNAVKNELTERHHTNFSIDEYFTYDNNNRLTNWTDPKTGQLFSNTYDDKGRITVNDQLGNIGFTIGGNIYRASKMNLNANGLANYGIGGTNILLQSVLYNENNDPIKIRGRQNDYAFEYGLSESRQVMHYGGKFDSTQEAQFTKYYSLDGSMEVVRNNSTGTEKHIIYIGGSPYESNIIYLKDYAENSGSYKFLHKDYLGSILAISDEAGNALEIRHFDAWGIFTHLKIGNNTTITDANAIRNANLLLDRGYTSHEHLLGVDLIHMNGRLYDPLLRRFLNADENIQDPFNTQNYNKYGYVFNNPLMFSDPSGEFFFVPLIAAFIISAAQAVVVSTIMYMTQAIITGNGSNSGFLKSISTAAVTGGLFGGYGNVFTSWQGAASFLASQFLPEFSWRPTIFGQKFFISPSFAFGQGIGIGASVSTTFHMGDFSLDAGFGIMNYGTHPGSGTSGWEHRTSLMLNYDDGKTGFSLGTTWWGGLKGVDGESLNQRTGLIGLHSGDVRIKYENDGGFGISQLRLGDRGDSYRTASLNLSVGDYSVGFSLFTGYRGRDNQEEEKNSMVLNSKGKLVNPILNETDIYGRSYKRGFVNETGAQYRLGALYFGYKGYRFGVNSEHVRHGIQDRFIHGIIGDRGFENQSWDWKPYFQYQTINKFTSW